MTKHKKKKQLYTKLPLANPRNLGRKKTSYFIYHVSPRYVSTTICFLIRYPFGTSGPRARSVSRSHLSAKLLMTVSSGLEPRFEGTGCCNWLVTGHPVIRHPPKKQLGRFLKPVFLTRSLLGSLGYLHGFFESLGIICICLK